MSGRSCSAARVVFFKTQPQVPKAVPQGRDPNRYLELGATPVLQFDQSQIGLGFDPTLEEAIMLGQARTPIAANLLGEALPRATMLSPKSLDTLAADTKAFADLARAFTAFPRSNNPLPQILAQGAHRHFLMPKEYHQIPNASI
jgi:hypothetical protein